MHIPLVKVGMADSALLMPALQATLASGQIGEGEQVREFELAFAAAFGLPHALAMSSGTAALHASLHLAGVGPGDEVISTAMTAEPTNIAILHAGGRPVFADVDPANGNLDPASVEASITPRTRAILLVHYAGYPVAMEAMLEVARRYGLPLIEDCAHALGAHYRGAPVGTMGDFAIFSFQAIKHLTTGDGGVLVCRDEARLAEARRFRWFGLERGVDRTHTNIGAVGYKYNMNNINATIGLVQLQSVRERLQRHIANGRWFDRELAGIGGLGPAACDSGAEPSYWLYTLLADDWADVVSRLAELKVQASKLHRRNDAHEVFASSRRPLPGLDRFYDRLVHLPCGWWVDDETRERVADSLRKG